MLIRVRIIFIFILLLTLPVIALQQLEFDGERITSVRNINLNKKSKLTRPLEKMHYQINRYIGRMDLDDYVNRLYFPGEIQKQGLIQQLKFEQRMKTPIGEMVRYIHTVNGIPVYHSSSILHYDPAQRKIRHLINEVKQIERIPQVVERIDSTEALEKGTQYIRANKIIGHKIEKVYFPSETKGWTLCWKLNLVTLHPEGDWEIIIDIKDGDILQVRNKVLHARNTFNGRGKVFDPDPITMGQASYGWPYIDNGDQTNPTLDSIRKDVVLNELSFHDGKYWLEGPYVRVMDIEAPEDTIPAVADSADFNYTRNQQGFEAVMVYYHIDKIYRYLLQLGFSIPSLEQFKVDPHGLDGDDNSHYVPSLNYCAFGTGGVDDAEDAEVIWHEYEHAIQDNLSGEMDYTGETLSLVEGSSDYWAVSYARSISEYKWYQVFKWDGHNEYWAGREANLDWKYPQDYQPAHAGGQIWSSALMKIWEQLGKEVTDKLFIYTHLLWGIHPGLQDAARAFLMADKDLYNGIHLGAIYPVFKYHGLVSDSLYSPQITHIPLKDQENTAGPFTVNTTVSGIIPDLPQVTLYYSYNDTLQMNSISMNSPDSVHFSANIPGISASSYDVYYRIEAVNSFGVTSRYPENNYLTFHVGVDSIPPEVSLSFPDSFPIQKWPLQIDVIADDNVGVDSVVMFVSLNDTLQNVHIEGVQYSENQYKIQFPDFGALADGDSVFFKIKVVDKSSGQNEIWAPIKGFYRIRLYQAEGYILLVQDDVTDTLLLGKNEQIKRTAASINASSKRMKDILEKHKYAVDTVSIMDVNPSLLGKYDLIIHSAGGNVKTLQSETYRTALKDWLMQNFSHKCIFEGGELFYNWFPYSFGQSVLHVKKWHSDDGGNGIVKTGVENYSFYKIPYQLPTTFSLNGSGENIRDVVSITTDAMPIFSWASDTSKAALYLFDPDPDTTSAQMVYMPFNFAAIQDSLVQTKVLMNMVTYLMREQIPPAGKIVLHIYLQDSLNHSGTSVTIFNPYFTRTIVTPATGEIVLDSLYPGQYIVHINHPTFSPSNIKDTLILAKDSTLIREYTLVKNLYGTILEGRVINKDSIPVTNAIVTILDQMNTDTTDSTGSFHIPYISPGKIQVSVSKEGYIPGVYSDSIALGERKNRLFMLSKGYFNDFETGLEGISLSGEFEMGESQISTILPFSGAKMIGVNLKGNYSNNTISEVQLPSVTLVNYAHPQLYFYLRYITEATYDGMQIVVYDEDNGTETIISPARGYNTNSVAALNNTSGWSGDNQDWELVQCDLSSFINRKVRIIIRFASDESITDTGVFIDDLGIKDEEIILPVSRLETYYNHGVSKVLLKWEFERRLQIDGFSKEKGVNPQPVKEYKLKGIQVLRGTNANNLIPIFQLDSLISTNGTYQYEDTLVQFNQRIFYAIRANYENKSLSSDTIEVLVKDSLPLFYEDFEAASLYGVPIGWTVVNRDSGIGNVYIGEKWEVRKELSRNDLLVPVTAHSGSQWIGIGKNENQSGIANEDYLITPMITSSSPVRLEFFAISTDYKASESVGIGTISTLSELDSGWVPDTIITDIPSYWKRYEITVQPVDPNFYIVFYYGVGNPNFILRLDDIAVLTESIVDIEEKDAPEIISSYMLGQNYPNPFNPGTDIPYAVPEKATISLHIYNVLGQRIRTLFEGERMPGRYVIHWDGKDANGHLVPSGIYFYSLEAGSVRKIRKMLLIR